MARICREAGARVRENVLLRDMNIAVPAADMRRIEVLASGLLCFRGAQLAVDVAMSSPLRGDGNARPRAARMDGAAIQDAIDDKERTYPELMRGTRCRLQVLALEASGRMSHATIDFLLALARARAQAAPACLWDSAAYVSYRRWARMLAVSAAAALADSLLREGGEETAGPVDGAEPWLLDVISDARHDMPVAPSRLA